MATHKFKVGETVELYPGRLDPNAPRGLYRIERLLPVESGNVQYRVKYIADGHERVVTEDHLSMPQSQEPMIGMPDMPQMNRAERGLKWEARDASPPQNEARAAHTEKHGAG